MLHKNPVHPLAAVVGEPNCCAQNVSTDLRYPNEFCAKKVPDIQE